MNAGILDPQGPVAAGERLMLVNATVIMLAVIVPVIVMTIAFAWWFREGNRHATRRPDWEYSGPVEIVVWAIPLLVILFLGGIAWIGSHDLAPRRPLAGDAPALEIQVVSLDWKWLFIYPKQGIASVNHLVVPAGTPLKFDLTSATVMNSFFVPQLGSQIYTMAGMTTQLHLLADRPGVYPGMSAQFSGEGFSDMTFDVRAVGNADFEQWVAQAKAGGDALNDASYQQLAQPGTAPGTKTYGTVADGLFDNILMLDRPMPTRTSRNMSTPAAAMSANRLLTQGNICSAN